MAKPYLTEEQIKELWYYKDGNLHNINSRGMARKDAIAGTVNGRGYRHIRRLGEFYLVHRLVWIYFNGEIDNSLDIDHINRIKLDNRIENLRLVTSSVNRHNTEAPSNNVSGVKGVYWNPVQLKWMASKITDGTRITKRFESFEEACEARMRM
jgi:hypothetical protein